MLPSKNNLDKISTVTNIISYKLYDEVLGYSYQLFGLVFNKRLIRTKCLIISYPKPYYIETKKLKH